MHCDKLAHIILHEKYHRLGRLDPDDGDLNLALEGAGNWLGDIPKRFFCETCWW
jgi:hypothetical protein